MAAEGAVAARTGLPPSQTVFRLSVLVGLVGLVVAGVGLLWQGSGDQFSVTTFRGQTAELYGRGLYQYDTLVAAGNNKASDLVTLLLGLPLLAISLRLYVRGSLRGRLLLLGTLGYFVYIGASYVFGAVAYNELFLVYVALFSASLFSFVLTFVSFDEATLRSTFSARMPRRGPGAFLLASGVLTLGIWLMDPISALIQGGPPKRLDTYTTLFTHAFDIGIIVPAAIIAGVMILRRRPLGYLVAFSLLILEAALMPLITAATISQVRLGLSFTPGEVVGPIAGFSILAVLAIWVIITILRKVLAPAPDTVEVMSRGVFQRRLSDATDRSNIASHDGATQRRAGRGS